MHQRRDRQSGVEPSDALKVRILGLRSPLTLDELFADDQGVESLTLGQLRKVARLKVIGVFRVSGEASCDANCKQTGISYVLPGSGALDQLATSVGRLMKGPHDFVRTNDLPLAYQGLATQWRNSMRAHIRHLLLLEAVEELWASGAQLWHFPGDQEWMAAQSLIDEYDGLLRDVKGSQGPRRRVKRDQRTWHGRPSCQRGRVMEGTSVGYAA